MSTWDWDAAWTWPAIDLSDLSLDLSHVNRTLHLRAFLWGLAMTLFGFIVLGFDTRPVKGIMPIIRDRILGIEQRYFLVIFNGILLYATLLFLLEETTAA